MSNRRLILSLIFLAVVAGVLYFFRGYFVDSLSTKTPQTKSFSYTLTDKTKTSGSDTMTVTEGDTVQINITADKDWPELHIHGYELHAPIKANITTTKQFTADKTGNFLVEVHFSDTNDADALTLGSLQVYPK